MTASRCAALPPVLVLGLGTGDQSISPDTACLLENIEVLAAPRRMLEHFPDKRCIALAAPLEKALEALEQARAEGKRCAVLADGDPLLFGIGATLAARPAFSAPESLRIIPGISAMQTGCARLRLPWHNLSVLSLHGRKDWLPLAHAVLTGKPLCIYTDCRNNAAAIAAFLLERGMDRFQMIVASCLNTNDERISSHTLSEAAATAFRGDESVFLLPLSEKEQTGTLRFGLDESRLALDRGLYTKAPVRAAALSLLSPSPENTLWDIGAGCGCLSLEAATLLHRGRVVALERDPSRADLIRENRRRLGLPHLDVVSGSAPEALEDLPDPDLVFVGGGLGGKDVRRAERLLERIVLRLKPGSRMVVAAALLSTLHVATEFARKQGLRHSVTQIQAAETVPLAGSLTFRPLNPVFLIGIFPDDPLLSRRLS